MFSRGRLQGLRRDGRWDLEAPVYDTQLDATVDASELTVASNPAASAFFQVGRDDELSSVPVHRLAIVVQDREAGVTHVHELALGAEPELGEERRERSARCAAAVSTARRGRGVRGVNLLTGVPNGTPVKNEDWTRRRVDRAAMCRVWVVGVVF